MDDAMAVIRDLMYFDGAEDRPVLELFAEYLQTTADEVTAYGTAGSVTWTIVGSRHGYRLDGAAAAGKAGRA